MNDTWVSINNAFLRREMFLRTHEQDTKKAGADAVIKFIYNDAATNIKQRFDSHYYIQKTQRNKIASSIPSPCKRNDKNKYSTWECAVAPKRRLSQAPTCPQICSVADRRGLNGPKGVASRAILQQKPIIPNDLSTLLLSKNPFPQTSSNAAVEYRQNQITLFECMKRSEESRLKVQKNVKRLLQLKSLACLEASTADSEEVTIQTYHNASINMSPVTTSKRKGDELEHEIKRWLLQDHYTAAGTCSVDFSSSSSSSSFCSVNSSSDDEAISNVPYFCEIKASRRRKRRKSLKGE